MTVDRGRLHCYTVFAGMGVALFIDRTMAISFGNQRVTPEQANRFARGEVVTAQSGIDAGDDLRSDFAQHPDPGSRANPGRSGARATRNGTICPGAPAHRQRLSTHRSRAD